MYLFPLCAFEIILNNNFKNKFALSVFINVIGIIMICRISKVTPKENFGDLKFLITISKETQYTRVCA